MTLGVSVGTTLLGRRGGRWVVDGVPQVPPAPQGRVLYVHWGEPRGALLLRYHASI